MNKIATIALCLVLSVFASSLTVNANTELWTKTFDAPVNGESYLISVGLDGSVALVDSIRRLDRTIDEYVGESKNVLLYDRYGDLVQEFEITPFGGNVINYVSQHEIIISGYTMDQSERVTDLHQLNSGGQMVSTRYTGEDAFVYGGSSTYTFKYPYWLKLEYLEGGGVQITLSDLTLADVLEVVGDAVIGVHGRNLKVRWKTVANTKYKVQSSVDLETWTDYTEIIDGNGATMVVNIPLSDTEDSMYARVVKL